MTSNYHHNSTSILNYLVFIILLLSFAIACNQQDLQTIETVEKSFGELFIEANSLILPDFIQGRITYFDSHVNGNLVLSDASTQFVWLYIKEKDEWKKLVIDKCHPGIENSPIGLAFSDDSILLSNSARWAGYRFNLDGSCGDIFVDTFIPPNFITGIPSGFLGITNDFTTKAPYIGRYDQQGNLMFKAAYVQDPNPVFSDTVIGGGIAVLNDSIALVTSASTPEIHAFNFGSGEFVDVNPLPVPEIFEGVNDRFDSKKFDEMMFMYLTSLGPHMIVSNFGILNDSFAFFYISYMLTEDDDLYIIQNLNNGASYWIPIPKNDEGVFISNGKFFRFEYLDEGTKLYVYKLNEAIF